MTPEEAIEQAKQKIEIVIESLQNEGADIGAVMEEAYKALALLEQAEPPEPVRQDDGREFTKTIRDIMTQPTPPVQPWYYRNLLEACDRLDAQQREIAELKHDKTLLERVLHTKDTALDTVAEQIAGLNAENMGRERRIESLTAENAKLNNRIELIRVDIESGCHEHTIGTTVDEDGCCVSCGEDLNSWASLVAENIKCKEEIERLKKCATCGKPLSRDCPRCKENWES